MFIINTHIVIFVGEIVVNNSEYLVFNNKVRSKSFINKIDQLERILLENKRLISLIIDAQLLTTIILNSFGINNKQNQQ